MVDDQRTEEEEHEAPAENIGDRAFRRVGPGGVLDHTAMMGTLDTTDTGAHGVAALESLAPIFKVAHAHDMAVAARALDPDDDGVSERQVQLSQGLTVVQGDPEGDKRRVLENAKRAQARLDEEADFDPKFTAHFNRQAEAERAWVASMADMQPSLVVGSTPMQTPPVTEEVQEAREEAIAEQQGRETEPDTTQVPSQRPASEPKGEPRKTSEETPAVEPKQFSEEEDKKGDGEDFNALWTEASEKAKNEVDKALQEGKQAQAPKKPNRASSKHDWVEWALYVDPALSRDKAEAMRREELIEAYIKKNRPNENK